MHKKILVITACNYLRPGISGGDNIFLQMLVAYSRENTTIVLGNKDTRELLEGRGLSCKCISSFDALYSLVSNLRLLRYVICTLLSFANVVKLVISGRRIDYVFSSSDYWPDILPAALLKLFKGASWIAAAYFAAPRLRESLARFSIKYLYINFFYNLSQFIAFPLIRMYSNLIVVCCLKIVDEHFKKKNFFLLRGGVDSGKLTAVPGRNLSRDGVLVFMARFHPQKGPLLCLQIFERLGSSFPHLRLRMIGDGPEMAACLAYVRSHGLEARVEFCGILQGDLMNARLAESDVFLHPVVFDTGGMAPLEAMKLGVPMVSFDHGEMRDMYPVGSVLVPDANVELFVEAVKSLLSDANHFKRLSLEAKQLAGTYDWENQFVALSRKLKEIKL